MKPASAPTSMTTHTRALRVVAAVATAAASLLGVAALHGTSNAAAGDGITAYYSPPFVQGPPSGYGGSLETFDGLTPNACNVSSLTGSPVGTWSGSCRTFDGQATNWGGATTTSDTPTVGGTPSIYPVPPLGGALTVTFTSPARYLGFWWSAGSATDTVTVYGSDPNTAVATFTTAQLKTTLGATFPCSNPFPGPDKLTSIDGTKYFRDYYWGRPSAYASLTPTALPYGGSCTNDGNNIYPHAYVSFYASGTSTISKVSFSGDNFEFDNVAMTTTAITPPGGLVPLQSVLGKTVTFDANGGTGTMAAETSTDPTTLTANAFTRAGFTFTGWNTKADGTGTAYTDAVSYDFSADLTLYAQWTADSSTTTTVAGSSTTTTVAGSSTTTTSVAGSTTTTTASSTTTTTTTTGATSTTVGVTTTTVAGATTTTSVGATTTSTTAPATTSTTKATTTTGTVLVSPFTTTTAQAAAAATTTSMPPMASTGSAPTVPASVLGAQVSAAPATAGDRPVPAFTGSSSVRLAELAGTLVALAVLALGIERLLRRRTDA